MNMKSYRNNHRNLLGMKFENDFDINTNEYISKQHMSDQDNNQYSDSSYSEMEVQEMHHITTYYDYSCEDTGNFQLMEYSSKYNGSIQLLTGRIIAQIELKLKTSYYYIADFLRISFSSIHTIWNIIKHKSKFK